MKRFNDEYNREILEIVKKYGDRYASFIQSKLHNVKIQKEYGKPNHLYLKNYIMEATSDILPENVEFSLRVFFVLNKITEFPKCETCGKPLTNMANTKFRLKFVDGKLHHQRFCSGKCKMENPKTIEKIQSTLEKKYGEGIINSFQAEECKKKAKQTKLEKYGDPEYRNIKKIRETFLKKYGNEQILAIKSVQEKIMKTNLEKYGVRRSIQLHSVRSKMRKKYFYDGQKFDSSWEVIFYIFHKDQGNVLIHEPTRLEYTDSKGIMHYYFPDFKIGNVYFDMKGNQFFKKDRITPTKENKDKYEFMLKIGVKILRENDMQPYFDYCKQKFNLSSNWMLFNFIRKLCKIKSSENNLKDDTKSI